MRCDQARELLWPPEEPKLADQDVLEAREHVETCEGCRDYLAQDAALVAALRRAREVHAPAEVRERIFDALARERTAAESRRPQSRMLLALSVAAILALVMIPGFGLLMWGAGSGGDPPQPVAVAAEAGFVEDFLRRAVQAEHIETSDPAEVARFLARELGLAEPLPTDFAAFDLAGAEVCIVEGVRGAVVIYKRNGKVLYHYLIPKQADDPQSPSLSTARPPDWAGQVESPSVVTWASREVQQALVSDIAPDELLELARRLATQG